MTTPEGKVKIKVRELLREFDCYYFQPVQMGYGRAGLDFHCVVAWNDCAIAFFIETKDWDKDLTERQKLLANTLSTKHKANVFRVRNETELRRLRQWLIAMRNQSSLLQATTFSVTTTSP